VPQDENQSEAIESDGPADKKQIAEPKAHESDETSEADAEVQELLSKAEAAVAKAAAIRADRDERDVLEEARLAEIRRKVDNPIADRPAEESSPLEPAGEGEDVSVDVGDFSFPRRGAKAKPAPASKAKGKAPSVAEANKRRKTDEAEANAEKAPEGLDEFGFKRRESKKSTKETAVSGRRKSDSKASSSKDDQGDVQEVAEKSRNQWGSFQRGKSEAENAADDAEQATADTAGNSAGKKEK